jgi:hypothetical protein
MKLFPYYEKRNGLSLSVGRVEGPAAANIEIWRNKRLGICTATWRPNNQNMKKRGAASHGNEIYGLEKLSMSRYNTEDSLHLLIMPWPRYVCRKVYAHLGNSRRFTYEVYH